MIRTEIIQQLNEADIGRGHNFLYFMSSYPIDVRLSVYCTNSSWAIVMESLVFWVLGVEGHLSIQLLVYCFGNELRQAPGFVNQTNQLTTDGPSGPLFDPQDVTELLINPTTTDMTIRHTVVPITTDPTQYAAIGIKLKLLSNCSDTWSQYIAAGYKLGQPPRILGYELLRLIAPKYRRLFFVTEAEINQLIGGPMPLLLRLDEWRHSDRDKGEIPADSESFQMIADVIACNDPSLYKPKMASNTHWSHWPMAGTA